MAASARWFGKIRSALGVGTSAAKECTCRVMRELPPPGYVITSSGLLVPVKHVRKGLNGSGRVANFIETAVIEKMENASSLLFRFTGVIVSAGACHFAIKLTWYESTEKGRLHYYLPGPNQDLEEPLEAPPREISPAIQNVINEISTAELAKFSEGCIPACQSGDLLTFLDNIVLEHKVALMEKGLQRETISDAQTVFFSLVKDASKKCLLKSFRDKQESVASQEGGEGIP